MQLPEHLVEPLSYIYWTVNSTTGKPILTAIGEELESLELIETFPIDVTDVTSENGANFWQTQVSPKGRKALLSCLDSRGLLDLIDIGISHGRGLDAADLVHDIPIDLLPALLSSRDKVVREAAATRFQELKNC